MIRRVMQAAIAAVAVVALSGPCRSVPGADWPALAPVTAAAAAEPLLGSDLWGTYRSHYIFPEGRLGDDANNGVSHSEGQGYAMLLSVFADDRPTFARLWAWTTRELMTRPDGLASWRWRPTDNPHVKDRNNATDGDLLIAWALVEAADRWRVPDYRAAARRIAVSVGQTASRTSSFGRVLMPGVTGFGANEMADGPVVNLSYWVFPAFDALATVAPEVDWNGLRVSGLALLRATRFGPAHLPSDWVSLAGDTPAPAKSYSPNFGYDAIRIPLYVAWANMASFDVLEPFVESWNDIDDRPSIVNVVTGLPVEPFYDRGYQAVVALSRCAVAGIRFPDDLRTVKLERYYSTTLQLLSMVAVRRKYPQCW